MSSNVAQFTLDVRRLGAQAPAKALSQFVRGVALEAGKRIIQRTPVDTGRARGSWQTTMGAPAAVNVERIDKSGASAQRELFDVSAQLSLTPYTPLYITSNLPYIRVLEFGLYPKAGDRVERFADFSVSRGKPLRVAKYMYSKKTGKRRALSDKQRAKRYQEALISKTTPEGFSTKAPRGMVGITFEEMRLLVASATYRKGVIAGAATSGVQS